MATQYFARPKLQLFGVATAFVVRRIGALRLGWEDFKANERPRPPIGQRYAADFPASLFPWSHES